MTEMGAQVGWYLLAAVCVAFLVTVVFLSRKSRKDAARQMDRFLEQTKEWIRQKTEAETRATEVEKRNEALIAERSAALADRDRAIEARNEAEKLAAVRLKELEETVKRMADWEKTKEESNQAANTAALAAMSKMSTILLDDHKRVTEAAKKEAAERMKESEERGKEATKSLLKDVHEVTKTVAALRQSVGDNTDTLDTLWRAVSTPTSASHFAEIALENRLKSHGLEIGRDFVMQYAIDGRKLRPDAVIFLPNNVVLVVDCKASKVLVDIAQSEGADDEGQLYGKLARTMSEQLTELSKKDYAAEIHATFREAGRSGEIKQTFSLMLLPNEGAVEKLRTADPEIERRATRLGIKIAGPAALECLIGFSRMQIDLVRQAENYEKIIDRTRLILDRIGVVAELSGDVGKGLKTAAKAYAKLTNSMNTRLLPVAHGYAKYGIQATRHKGIPKKIPTFQVVDLDDAGFIEGEAEELLEAIAVTDETGKGEEPAADEPPRQPE